MAQDTLSLLLFVVSLVLPGTEQAPVWACSAEGD